MPVTFPDIPEHVRAYFYRLVVAALPVLVLLGFVEVDEVAAWLALAAALLATANTSTKADDV